MTTSTTSKPIGRGERGKQLMNYYGYSVRTMAPVNVKNWEDAFLVAIKERMWREVQVRTSIYALSSYHPLHLFLILSLIGHFELIDNTHYMSNLQCFVIVTILWKPHLYTAYKQCGTKKEEKEQNPPNYLPKINGCIVIRNSKNQLSEKWCKHTIGNLSFVKVEDMHLEWANYGHSKEVYQKCQLLITKHSKDNAPKTNVEMLLTVLRPRSGDFYGKGTGVHGYAKRKFELWIWNSILEGYHGHALIQVCDERSFPIESIENVP
ncbi:hypothetical protein Cgig2_013580 [Carnegiea gigantea]|uniref:Uncharacterized protein n=1 Tax=Carnegiea gigantea TaxID=171969 RepID=A0A9Q1KBQ3_9CARY|nr:hypothetical protein Cgig2_013580 [Carnegiea gigantea]